MCQNDTIHEQVLRDAARYAKNFDRFYDVQRKPANHEEYDYHENVEGDSDLTPCPTMNACV